MNRFTPAFFAAITIGSKASQIDRGRQLLVELEARVVGNAGQADERIVAFCGIAKKLGVTNVAFDDLEVRMCPWEENDRRRT